MTTDGLENVTRLRDKARKSDGNSECFDGKDKRTPSRLQLRIKLVETTKDKSFPQHLLADVLKDMKRSGFEDNCLPRHF